MARWADPLDLRLVIILLRSLRRWKQSDLVRETGIDKASMSQYEAGEKTPSQKTMERIATAVRVPYAFVEELIPLCRGIRLAFERAVARGAFEAADQESAAELDRELVDTALQAAAPLLIELAALEAGGPRAEDRDWAAVQWQRMEDLPAKEQQMIVDTLDGERIWALAERLGLASVAAAAHRADQALDLAQLAVRAAERVEGPELWRSLNQGTAWAFLANARRVAGNLPMAREGFRTSNRLWEAGEGGDPAGLLDGSRRLDLEASLWMDDNKLDKAVKLLDEAIAASRTEAAQARLLVKQSAAFVLKGDAERVVEVLKRAAPLIDEEREPRLAFAQRFNWAAALCELRCYGEAQEMLPRVRDLAVKQGRELDLTRLLWLEAKVSAGFGRLEDARAVFEQVCRIFADQGIAYDYAQACLDLALLHLEQGRTGEVKRLAEEMWRIFQSQEVHKEALAALKLFCDAAKKEQVDAGWVRRLIAYFRRAQGNPSLHFEP